ncbi:MAG: hypothetical protein KBC21_01355 [Candidatus Pacebacteria bacterium]|nr:hypothetical protein [Candidatus Paceibacterota bacterium]
MSAIILFILPSSALLYVAQLFFVYSVIFGRAELDLLSSQAYQAFDYFSQMYAEKSVN